MSTASTVNILYHRGTFVTTDKSVFVEHKHSKPVVHIRICSGICTVCEFGHMYNDMYPPLQYHTSLS